MTSPYEQEVQRIQRFSTALEGGAVPAPTDDVDRQIDAVGAAIRQHRGNPQAGTSLLNVRRSARDDINLSKTRLATQIDELIQLLAPPADLLGKLLDLYLPGYSQGYPVNGQTRRAVTAFESTPTPGVLGSISPLALWNVPQDSPVRTHLEAWLELHVALKDVDVQYDTLSSAQTDLLTAPDSEQVLDDDLDWGPFLTQVLTVTDLTTGEVQVLNLTHAALTGADWVLTTMEPLPPLLTGSVLRLSTSDDRFTGDLPHSALVSDGDTLRVLGVPTELHDLLHTLTVADLAQVTVLQATPPIDPTRTLN